MVEDDETKKVKNLDDFKNNVTTLIKDVKSLKKKTDILTDGFAQLEILDFQKQIVTLNDKIELLSKSLLETKRLYAINDMNLTQFIVCQAIQSQHSGRTEVNLKELIRMSFARFSEKVKQSDEPLNIMLQFRTDCIKLSKEYNLKAFV